MPLSDYIYKSDPFDHQRELMELQCDKDVFAFLMEQGTGKSKPTVDTAAYLYEEGEIRLFVVIAPNGVHSKWAIEDIPLSLPDRIERDVHVWKSDGTKRNQRGFERLRDKSGDHLRILCINVEYMQTQQGCDLLESLLKKYRAFIAVDESVSIMTPTAKRTKHIWDLGGWAEYRRILTGTPVVKAPFDLYGQFYFLDWRILGEPKFAGFKVQYGEFYPPHHPLVLNILCKQHPKLAQIKASWLREGKDLKDFRVPKEFTYRTPPILAEEDGKPKYKNLERLKNLIAPFSYRKTKAECFDLPPKVYQKRFFSMTPDQRRFYDDIRDQNRGVLEDRTIIVDHKLTVQLRLHQIACGYMPTGDEDVEIPFFRDDESKNPRVQSVMAELEEGRDAQQIIWCRFKREISVFKKLLGNRAVTYYGDTEPLEGRGMKEENKARFKAGDVQYLIGTTPSGGVGNNFANSSKATFCSNNFSYYYRIQAEDRQHRHGLGDDVESVVYTDIEAEDSVDQDISASNKLKQDLGDYMMGKAPVDTGWLYD